MIFFVYVLVGFLAEMIDGTIGMAYGVSCRTFLKLFAGVPSSIVSAVVHYAELPTTFISGVSHWKLKNIEKKLFVKLLIPGIIGGVLGTYCITNIGNRLEIFIDIYLIIIGFVILKKVFAKEDKKKEVGRLVFPLGFLGGFLDAAGGGGWGPIVTSTLLISGNDAKKSIGTVNAAEFIITVAETTTFVALINDFQMYTEIIIGLILGGGIAAPLSATLCKKIEVKPLLCMVGVLIIILNSYNLIACFI